jgi:predicted molibdopterin-dependent oxidoreductase YjgC
LTKNGRVIGSLPDHQAGVECLCVKGRFGFSELLNHPTRLTQPQKAAEGGWRLSIAWEETIQMAADKLSGIAPEKFEMVVSPNCSLESLYVAQKFTRQGLKSNNIHTQPINGYAQVAKDVYDLIRQSQPLSILAGASTIVCLGLDRIFNQSVIEVKLHQAKLAGARIVAALSDESSLGRFADLWLPTTPGNEAGLIDGLGADLLLNPGSLVILVGPAIFNHTDRRRLIPAINSLVQLSGARLVVLPEQADLTGLLMAIPGRDQQTAPAGPDVLYLFGENDQAQTAIPNGHPFTIYQNIYPPADGLHPDLILPTAAFSEEDGRLTDYAGHIKELHRAVPPPGEALPAWEILCRIARKMGLAGFDFANVDDIRAEMACLPAYSLMYGQVDWTAVPQPTHIEIGRQTAFRPIPTPDTYLGFPLTEYVQGLRQLAPARTRNSDG